MSAAVKGSLNFRTNSLMLSVALGIANSADHLDLNTVNKSRVQAKTLSKLIVDLESLDNLNHLSSRNQID